jgi:BrxA
MTDFAYNSDLIGGSLMIRESRVVADLLLQDVSPEAWAQAIEVDNLLQKRTISTAKRNAIAIRKRLETLEPMFWRAIRDGDDELATQAALCATLERNLLLVEFFERVLNDAYLTHSVKIEAYQWFDFLEESAKRDPAIFDWSESTKKKMRQVVFRILVDVGYLKGPRNLELQQVIIRPEIKTMLDESYRYRILACMEVSNRMSD